MREEERHVENGGEVEGERQMANTDKGLGQKGRGRYRDRRDRE